MLSFISSSSFLFSRATDVWGLGCLIWEVFNQPLPQLSSLKTVAKVGLLLLVCSWPRLIHFSLVASSILKFKIVMMLSLSAA